MFHSLKINVVDPPPPQTCTHIRLSRSCHKKCIPPKYHEGELTKGEAICLDRCVAKFMEVHDRIGKKLMTSMQDEGAMKQMAGPQR